MLPALAFVPQDDVIESFKNLIETNYFSTNEELLSPLIDYFESNWIGRLQHRHRREPKFSIPIWNCFSPNLVIIIIILIIDNFVNLFVENQN